MGKGFFCCVRNKHICVCFGAWSRKRQIGDMEEGRVARVSPVGLIDLCEVGSRGQMESEEHRRFIYGDR